VKVVVLTRNPHGIASRFLARRPGPVILDEAAGRRELRRTVRKLRRVGLTAAPVGLALRRAYADAGSAPALEEVATEVVRVPTLNGDEARDALRRLAAEVAISLYNAIIRPETFSLPVHGTINVHHGDVPDYRGGPPVFWELRDGLDRVGFTIHLIDAGIDTGPVLARGDIPIERRATLAQTLAATIPRLHEASLDALEAVLDAGVYEGEPQFGGRRHRTTPTLGDYLNVRRSLRH
jgi:folate-dependent phosphoribosylglycinamide formyltransferase PurN